MMVNPMSLIGKRILITGASSGIGRACSILAAQLGASVVLTGRRRNALDETLRRMEAGGQHQIITGDIGRYDFIKELFCECGRIDGLIHAAGIGPMCPVGLEEYEHLEEVFHVNAASFVMLMKYCSKIKYRNASFSAVAISSVAAFSGWAGVSAYSASKGALSSVARALAMELSSKGVRVNTVCPSNIKTPMYEAGSASMNDEKSLADLLKLQPLGLGLPEQVASVACFLISDAASFVTGVNLPVDGGYLAH